MPRVSRSKAGTVTKVHIKFVSMAPKTLIKYRLAVRRFLWWRRSAGFPYPSAVADFDHQVSEFINHLYLDDSPLGWATDCISGLKRLFPRCRRHLDTASLYHSNWVKATRRVKALPLTPELVRGVAAFSMVQGNTDFALTILIMFAGLLRIGETLQLRLGHFNCLRDNCCIISLWESKGAKRTGEPEVVFLRDRSLIRVIQSLKAKAPADSLLFGGSYRTFASLLIRGAAFYGLAHPTLTPHSLRRGGATWYFSLYHSYDRTMLHGRWKQQQTAKGYIDEALAELSRASLPESGVIRLERAEALFSCLFLKHFQ
jgi:integrase